MHGKTSLMHHDGKTIFRIFLIRLMRRAIIPLLLRKRVTRLLRGNILDRGREIMALRHKTLPIEGVQFHPESIMTSHGKELLQNFIRKYSPSATLC